MELKINIDLEAALAQALAPEKLQPILDKHIVGAITSAIDDATGYRSAFRTLLKDQLAAALPHGLAMDDMAKFQQVLNQSMAGLAQGLNAEAIRVALEKVASSVITTVPTTIKLSALIDKAREGLHVEDRAEFYALYEPSEYGGGWLSLDADPRCYSAYGASIRLAVNKDGDVYSLRFDGHDVTPSSRPNVISEFEAILMAMYVGRTRLEVDMDNDDVQSAAGEQYDD